jgi:hypothetical protein
MRSDQLTREQLIPLGISQIITWEPLGANTIVHDNVRYAVLGDDLVNGFLVRPDLERVFDYRAAELNAWALTRLRQAGFASAPGGAREV